MLKYPYTLWEHWTWRENNLPKFSLRIQIQSSLFLYCNSVQSILKLPSGQMARVPLCSAPSPFPCIKRCVSALLLENRCQLDPSIAASSPPYPDLPALTVKLLVFHLLKQQNSPWPSRTGKSLGIGCDGKHLGQRELAVAAGHHDLLVGRDWGRDCWKFDQAGRENSTCR